MSDIEQTDITFIDSSEASLTHYGVQGMKWGVWNEETRAKYQGGNGLKGEKAKRLKKMVADRVYTAKKAASKHYQEHKESSAAKRQGRSEARAVKKQEKADTKAFEKETMKKYGLRKKQYDKLRKQTLNSNDPTVVARGMHLLSDSELNSKIDRLERESKIRNLSTIKKTTEAKAKKEAAEARSKTLPYQLGKMAGQKAINTLNDNLLKPIAGDAYKKYAQSVENAVNSAKTKETSNIGEDARRVRETVAKNNSSIYEPIEATVISVQDIPSGSAQAKSYASDGRKLLEEAKKTRR